MLSEKTSFILVPTFHANTVDAYVPEFWAQESLMFLEENMVIAGLCHRDFENEIASHGDIVNTRKPSSFTAKRKGAGDDVTLQDVTVTNVPVKLDQLVHTSFILRDAEMSKSLKDLIAEHIEPAMIAQANFVDKCLLGQAGQFLDTANCGHGNSDGLTSTNAKGFILDAKNGMDKNLCPVNARNLIWAPDSQTEALKLDLFVSADKLADGGRAMQEAELGRVLGFNHYMSQNASSVGTSNVAEGSVTGGAINKAAGYGVGATVLVVDGFTGAVADNQWITIAGDDTPHRIEDHSETAGNTTGITLAAPGLRKSVADNAAIKVYEAGAVNLGAGYAIGYDGTIVYDGTTNDIQQGALVSFTNVGAATMPAVYSVIEATSTTILLDRPLEVAISDNDAINLSPPGDINFGFHRNALTLVSRPLAPPKDGMGARSAVVVHNNVAMRATMTYDGIKQGHIVTLDMLFGVKVLDKALGCVLAG